MSSTELKLDRGFPTRLLAGIRVPDTELVAEAIAYAHQYNEPFVFNHVMRSWLFAASLAEINKTPHDAEILAVATILHDIGLSFTFNGSLRFEVEGANAARDFAFDLGIDGGRAQLLWDSIALNSTPSIAMHKETEVAFCAAGTGLDWSGRGADKLPEGRIGSILKEYPRLAMKQQFTHALCEIVHSRPATTYDNFVRDFGERFVPEYRPLSAVDYLLNAPFDD